MLEYFKRHHIALLALFIALGGTSYAAVSLPRNSVGSAQLRKASVSESKLSRGVRAKLKAKGSAGPKGDSGAAGPQGPAGVAGAKGETGATGPQGDPGAKGDTGEQGIQGVPGPTSAGIGGVNVSVTPGGFTAQIGSPTTVTLDRPGKVLVQFHGTFGIQCGGAACSRTVGVTVGGQTVPGAFATIDGTAGTAPDKTTTATGILASVPAGTHAVTLVDKTSGSLLGRTLAGDVRVVAIAIGG